MSASDWDPYHPARWFKQSPLLALEDDQYTENGRNLLDRRQRERKNQAKLILYKNELGENMSRLQTLSLHKVLYDKELLTESQDDPYLSEHDSLKELHQENELLYKNFSLAQAIQKSANLRGDIRDADYKMLPFLGKLSDKYLRPLVGEAEKLQFVDFVLDEIANRIKELDDRFGGHFAKHGSSAQSTTIGSSSDLDFLFFMDELNLSSKQFATKRFDQDFNYYSVYFADHSERDRWHDMLDGNTLSSVKLHQKFFELMCLVVAKVALPEGVTHGGFLAPNYSGVRYHSSAISIVYRWHDEPLSIDIVQCLKAGNDISSRVFQEMPSILCDLCRHANKEGDWNFKDKLVLHPRRGYWFLNPEFLTIQFLENFRDDSPFKRTIRLVKSIKQAYLSIEVPLLTDALAQLVKELKSVYEVLSKENTMTVLKEIREQKQWNLFALSGKALAEIYGKSLPMSMEAIFHDALLKTEMPLWSVDPAILAYCGEETSKIISVTSCIFFYILVSVLMESADHGDISEFYVPSKHAEGELVTKVLEKYHNHRETDTDVSIPLTGDTKETEKISHVARSLEGVSELSVIYAALVDEVIPQITNLDLD